MRKKQRLVQIKPDETNIHTVGQERFVPVQNYVGDLPSNEPNDWFAQSEEYERLLEPSEANEPLVSKQLIDEP